MDNYELTFIMEDEEELEYEITVEDGSIENRDERIAIVIGVEKYNDENISNLHYTFEDANRIKDILRKKRIF